MVETTAVLHVAIITVDKAANLIGHLTSLVIFFAFVGLIYIAHRNQACEQEAS